MYQVWRYYDYEGHHHVEEFKTLDEARNYVAAQDSYFRENAHIFVEYEL